LSIATRERLDASIFRQSRFSTPAHPEPVPVALRTVTLYSARVSGT
jgi:hypothetical protein